MDPLATSSVLVDGNPAIKLVACPPAGPFVLHGKRQLRSTSVSAGMKSNAPELSVEGFVALILLNLLLLVVQFIVFTKDLSSWSASA
jgi:hypothetical protein